MTVPDRAISDGFVRPDKRRHFKRLDSRLKVTPKES